MTSTDLRPTDAPRVLYVTASFPFPLHSGYLRHHHLLRALSTDHHLHLVSLAGAAFDDVHVEGVAPFVGRVDVIRRPGTGRAHKLVRLLDPAHRDAAVTALVELVDREIRTAPPDVVVLSGKETAGVMDAVAGRVPVVADLCDATSARITQEMAVAPPVRRAGLRIRRRRMRRIEIGLVGRADVLTIASARDRVSLHEEGAPRRVLDALVLPNGIDLDHWRRRSGHLGPTVVFCGNLAYGPNADAARHLVLDVMPVVWARRPELEVVLVGRGASPALVGSLQGPRVRFTGEVDDVRPHLESGAVFAAPLRIATGIQNKLLEAMAMAIPVVTTPAGAAGLTVDGPPPVTVADTVDGLAEGIIRQIPPAGREPDHGARSWVGTRFNWTASGRAMAGAIAAARMRELSPC